MTHGTHAGYVSGCRCESCRDGEATYQREYRRRNRERLRAYDKQRDSRDRDDPAKRSARWKAWWSTRHERRGCEVCGAPDAQRHHDDYSCPLDVRWLCRTCHGREHRRRKRAA